MREWVDRSIKDLCVAIVDCVNKTAPSQTDPTPYKMLRTTNVRGGWVDTTNVKYVDEPTYAKWTRRMVPEPGDIILTREAPFGDVGMLRSGDQVFLGQRLIMYRPDLTECDPNFLMYALMGPTVQAELKRLASGSTVEHLRVPDCEKITVPCPSLDDQQRIGSILRSLDDLIENNRRRVGVLEEMARTIYHEWFVKFRYPGHQDIPLVESTLGPIPEDWSWVELDGLVRVVKATVDPTALNPDTPAVGLEHIPRQQMTLDAWGTAGSQGSRKATFEKGDVLFGKIRPYFHKVSVAPIDGICSTDAIVLRPEARHWGQVVMVASSREFVAHATQTSNGTKMPRADWKVIGQWQVPLPPTSVAESFTQVARDHLNLAAKLMLDNRALAVMRDLLLPKLVTGEIDICSLDLDAMVGEQVA